MFFEVEKPCDTAEMLAKRKTAKEIVDWICRSDDCISLKELERFGSKDRYRVLTMTKVKCFYEFWRNL